MSEASRPGFPLAPPPFSGACRRVEAGAGFDWLQQGWAFFRQAPVLWLAGGAVAVFFCLLLLIVPGIGKYASMLFLPLLFAGAQTLCQRQERDEPFSPADLLAGFRPPRRDALLTLGLIFAAAGFSLRLIAWALPPGGFFGDLLLTFFFLLPLLAPLAMAMLFAPALVHFHAMSPWQAIVASFRACATNWLALLVFAVLASLLFFFAVLPVFLGLFLLLPVLMATLHAAYRDIFPAT